MNLALDIGNSRIKIGLFNKDDLIESVEIKEAGLVNFLTGKSIQNAILSTVKALSPDVLKSAQQHCTNTLVLDPTTPLPIAVNYKTPETLGVDRLAAAVGALKYSQTNVLVIDIGTCITYDLIDSKHIFQGGLIAPGLNMRLKAMHEFTSGLPLAELKSTQNLIGKTTEECLLSGALNGTTAEITQIIRLYIQQFEHLEVIICGGDALFFENKLEIDIFVVPNLVLEGLNSILRFNVVD